MSKFYDLFPKIQYDIAKDGVIKFDLATNIFLRLGLISEVKNNAFSYYEYLIREQDTPENLADRLYGDSEYHWIILLMNDIVNPLFDWPMKQDTFNNFIISKYGSLSDAKTRIHHYEKVIRRTNLNANIFNEIQMEIDSTMYDSLPDTALENETLSSGLTIEVLITRRVRYCYDWEVDTNERKRSIKILKKEHVAQLLGEFKVLLEKSGTQSDSSRRLVR